MLFAVKWTLTARLSAEEGPFRASQEVILHSKRTQLRICRNPRYSRISRGQRSLYIYHTLNTEIDWSSLNAVWSSLIYPMKYLSRVPVTLPRIYIPCSTAEFSRVL